MHRMLIKKGSSEECPKGERETLSQCFGEQGREGERRNQMHILRPVGWKGLVGRRGHFIFTSMEKALEHGR